MRGSFLTAFLVVALGAASVQAQDSGFTTLRDRATFVFENEQRLVFTQEIERKAHDVQAARAGGRVDLTYSAGQQNMEILEAATLKADGTVTRVSPDKIFDVAPSIARETAMYTDHRTRSIVFADVEPGDSIRYVYRTVVHDGAWPKYSRTVAWPDSLRSKLAEWVFDHPEGMPFQVEQHGLSYREERAGGRIRRVFSWSNDKRIEPDGGSTSFVDWASRLSVSTFASYAEIGDTYGRLHATAAAVTPDVQALADEIVGSTADRRTQARLLYEWVAQKVRYVAVQIGSGQLTPTPAGETIRNRYGDCKAHVALLAALLAAKGIASEPALINIASARYVLPQTPVADFDHVILYLPELATYVEPTSHFAAFGVLPWGHHDKPVVHAVEGKSRVARTPRLRAEDNVAEIKVEAMIGADGRISGSTQESARGAMATDLKARSAVELNGTRAVAQMRSFGTPGGGSWVKAARQDQAPEFTIKAEFKQNDEVDLAAGEALAPPPGLRFLSRPGLSLMGTHDVAHRRPFICYAGRQIEVIEVTMPTDLRPMRLPANRSWTTSIAEYKATYAFEGGKLRVRREFVARPDGQACTPEQSRELVGLLSNIRRDYRSVVVFDKAL